MCEILKHCKRFCCDFWITMIELCIVYKLKPRKSQQEGNLCGMDVLRNHNQSISSSNQDGLKKTRHTYPKSAGLKKNT